MEPPLLQDEAILQEIQSTDSSAPPTPTTPLLQQHHNHAAGANPNTRIPTRYLPFTRLDYPLSWYEILKSILCLFTLTPVRLILSLLTMCLVYILFEFLFRILWRPCQNIVQLKEKKRCGSFWFRCYTTLLQISVRWGMILWGFYSVERVYCSSSLENVPSLRSAPQHAPPSNHTANFSSQVHGADSDTALTSPYIIVSNHLSLLDIFFMLHEFGSVSFLSRAALKKTPFFGRWMQIMDCLFVEDNDPAVRKQQLVEEIHTRQQDYFESMVQNRPSRPRLVIFPEGTTTNGKYLIQFHRGAFEAGKPVQPIFIHHPFQHFIPSWETIPLSVYIMRLSCQLVNRLVIYYMPTYYPSEEEKNDPLLYANNVREYMVKLVNTHSNRHGPYHVQTMNVTRKDKMDFHQDIISGKYKWNET